MGGFSFTWTLQAFEAMAVVAPDRPWPEAVKWAAVHFPA
jgi:hypothetical protein